MTNNQILIQECITQNYNDYSNFNNENEFFEFFCATQILKNYDLSDDEILNGIVGKGGDGGCDSIYLFIDNELKTPEEIKEINYNKNSNIIFTIIQSKKTKSFSEDSIMKWKTSSENLFDMSKKSKSNYVTRYNNDVLEMFKFFNEVIKKFAAKLPSIKINYFYATLGEEVHINVKEQANELKIIVSKYYPSAEINIDFIGANELLELYRKQIDETLQLDLADPPISLSTNTQHIALVNLATYYNFITNNNNHSLNKKIFEANVRDYQGNNSVNQCIINTLENGNTENDFWWFNNGVTILSDKITIITNRSISISNPEIVNGLQTSNEIYNYFSKNPNKLNTEKRNILIRLIVPQNERIRDEIIFATNNQTSIPKASLRVTDLIHFNIELFFKNKDLFYDRRKNYYRNQNKKRSDIVSVSFLAQCLISIILKEPHTARARPSTPISNDDVYNKLYSTDYDLTAYYIAAKIGKRVQTFINKYGDMTSSQRTDILFYLIYAL